MTSLHSNKFHYLEPFGVSVWYPMLDPKEELQLDYFCQHHDAKFQCAFIPYFIKTVIVWVFGGHTVSYTPALMSACHAAAESPFGDDRLGGAWMFMSPPSTMRAAATVHRCSWREGSAHWAIAVPGFARKFCTITSWTADGVLETKKHAVGILGCRRYRCYMMYLSVKQYRIHMDIGDS